MVIIVTACLVSASCAGGRGGQVKSERGQQGETVAEQVAYGDDGNLLTRQVMVELTDPTAAQQVCGALGSKQKHPRIVGLRWAVCKLPKRTTENEAQTKLAPNPIVVDVQNDSLTHRDAGPDDPLYPKVQDRDAAGKSLGKSETREDKQYQWALNPKENSSDVKAQQAWDIHAQVSPPATGSASASAASEVKSTVPVVAVIDGPIDIDHPDFCEIAATNEKPCPPEKSRIWTKPGTQEHGMNFVYGNRGSSAEDIKPKTDDDKHGTHVAGIVAAQYNNGIGVAGLAGGAAKIMPLVVYPPAGTGRNDSSASDQVAAIDYAITNGANVINMSLSGTAYNSAGLQAIQRAGERGILVVAAASNDGRDNDIQPEYPASYRNPSDGSPLPNLISVANLAPNGKLDSSSNYGLTVDMAAPGTDILSTVPGGNYIATTGTSMAAPMVSAAAALRSATYGAPTNLAEVTNLKNAIVNSSSSLPGLKKGSRGTATDSTLNAAAALDENPPPAAQSRAKSGHQTQHIKGFPGKLRQVHMFTERDGSILISEYGADIQRIKRLQGGTYGEVSDVEGGDIEYSQGVAVDPRDDSIVVASHDQKIWRIKDGEKTNIAGTGKEGFSGDGGQAKDAELNYPDGVAVASDGTIIFADSANNRIRQITPNGLITTIAGTGKRGESSGENQPAAQAALAYPTDIAIAPDGSIVFIDGYNTVRRIEKNTGGGYGNIATIVGGGNESPVSGAQATSVSLNPLSIAVNPTDNSVIVSTAEEIFVVKEGILSLLESRENFGAGPAVDRSFSKVSGGPDGELIFLMLEDSNYGWSSNLYLRRRHPAITKVDPASRPAEGGDTVTITGLGLDATKVVRFGGKPAVRFTVVSNSQIDAVPDTAIQVGPSFVEVVGPWGPSSLLRDNVNAYDFTGPVVTSTNPTSGPAAGGRATITGTRLNGAHSVTIGGLVRILSNPPPTDTEITVEIPQRPPGQYPVIVTTPEGTSNLDTNVKYLVR